MPDLTTLPPTVQNQLPNRTTATIRLRRRRQAAGPDRVEVNMGVVFDGLREFVNFTRQNGQSLTIITNPKVTRFAEVPIHRPYWPYNDEILNILVRTYSCNDCSYESNVFVTD